MPPLRLLKANTKKRRAEILRVLPNEREKEEKFFHKRLTVCDSRWSVPVNRPMYGDIPLMLCKISFYQRDMVGRWQMEMYKRQAFKTIDNKLVLEKKKIIIIKAPWPQIPWNEKKTKSPTMYKIIHELVDLNIIICNSPRKHEHVTVMRLNSSCPLAVRMPLNSPFSRGPLGSGISSQHGGHVVSIASCVQGESDYIFEQQFKLA